MHIFNSTTAQDQFSLNYYYYLYYTTINNNYEEKISINLLNTINIEM